MLDINQDGKIKIVIAGDSVVRGIGDSINRHNGGYPLRISRRLKNARVLNLGTSGFTSPQLLNTFQKGRAGVQVKNADYVIIDIGRNDCRPPNKNTHSVNTIKSIIKIVNRKTGEVKPLISVATQLPNRMERRSCIEDLNRKLLAAKSKTFPVEPRLDLLSAGVLASDGLHPTSSGYDTIANTMFNYLRKRLQKRAKERCPDEEVIEPTPEPSPTLDPTSLS